ncbi:alpha-amylase family protein [Bifidobacterium imperatoris]|uniref:Alpha-amylase n=1 Tax=Bifidobacterium imperatoris TaxID=2020965 RepID=A0A2N5IQE4_9BIFI|nr:alpha-amylase family protein [Bifidobacterium imperatoris]PLS24177.1 alpha-amylase [Bifidobacterium imperatoris]QSY57327.1 alpha-amylase family protein [Bifidobacterium imperatoris]
MVVSTDEGRNLPDWVRYGVFWQVYPLGFCGADIRPQGPRTFNGRGLDSMIDWLEYARNLGASGLLLGPIFESSTHGYDTLDHMHVDVRLGGDAAFDRLADACRNMGLQLILDGVFNHVSRQHPAVQAALDEAAGQSTADNPWHGLVRAHLGQDGQPQLDVFEGHGDLVDLDHDAPETVEYVARVMNHWLDRGAAGWRLDAAYAVPTSFWAKVLPQVKATHPYSWVFGEVIHGDYPQIVADASLDSVTQYELWKSIQHALETDNFFELDWNLKRHNAFLDSFVPQTFIGNHDVTRIASQIGPEKAALALAVLMTVGGVPSIYYGDEQGYVGVKQERFGGDDDVRPKFPLSPVELSKLGEPTYRLHQALIALRRRNPWLLDARTEAIKLENKRFVYRSVSADGNHSLTVSLSVETTPTFTITDTNGTVLYRY